MAIAMVVGIVIGSGVFFKAETVLKATGGDVLTGILAALLAQGYTQEDACRLGVYVHGLAGDIAAEEKGEIGTTSSDLIDALPAAWKKLTETKGRFTKE